VKLNPRLLQHNPKIDDENSENDDINTIVDHSGMQLKYLTLEIVDKKNILLELNLNNNQF
jgi:hypothetical protein